MAINRRPIFEATRTLLKRHSRTWVTYTPEEVALLDRAIDEAVSVVVPAAPPPKPSPAKPATVDQPIGFVLGEGSRKELEPVHPKLRLCVERAIGYSMVDFKVLQGERTLAEQRDAMRRGTTRTMKSKHLKQPDGLVWAVDLVAMVGGKISWEFDHYYYIAMAMDRAATELGIADHIRWGCAWDRVLSDYGGEAKAYISEVQAYKKRHAGSDFLDGPHFEWVA